MVIRINIGGTRRYLAFDGGNIWALDLNGQTVTKIRTRDGVVLGTYPCGAEATAIGFDGQHIWVANGYEQDSLTKLRASDGQIVGTYKPEELWRPSGIAFDGGYLWVVTGGRIYKLLPDSGTLVASVDLYGMFGYGNLRSPVFDGRDLWVIGSDQGGSAQIPETAPFQDQLILETLARSAVRSPRFTSLRGRRITWTGYRPSARPCSISARG